MSRMKSSESKAQVSLSRTVGDSLPVLVAAPFLFVPVIVLVGIAMWGQRTIKGDYLRAVQEATVPDPSHVSHSLVSIDVNKKATVVTWTRSDQVSNYQGKTAPSYRDTWVTVVPELKTFCQAYVKSQGADRQQLSHRLEQRLGLPPQTNYDTFVELTVDPKDITRFFRPCGDPSPVTNTCQPAPPLKPEQLKEYLSTSEPKKKQEMESRYWFLNNYYASFASSQYPWTSLGYTFDWAPKGRGDDFVRFGESEFVIPAGAPIEFVSATDTVAYCSPW